MSRLKSRYVCQSCGESFLRWEGQCRSCGAWNSLVETLLVDAPVARVARAAGDGASPVALSSVADRELVRRPVGIGELDRVLGGGLVPGSLVLLGGEPGIGKSTLVLEAAAGVARGLSMVAPAAGSEGMRDTPAPAGGAVVLYVSGEESAAQVRLRAGRLGVADGAAGTNIEILAETDLERSLEIARSLAPALLVVDSIQTMAVGGLEGAPGSLGQVREAAARLLEYAKTEGVPVILVGHVTKEGALAGPKALEHLVDAVLALEGERLGPLRILRATKNRFGATDEVGVFEMAEAGLREVRDPARAFIGEATNAPGAAVAATLEGQRPLLVEVQALVAAASYGPPRRTVSGLDPNRVSLLVAVLGRRAGVALGTHDVYASVVGGLTITEPAVDLPLALALASSLRDRPILPATIACGEVGLLGELRPVAGLERRLREAARLGFERAIVPAASTPHGIGIDVVHVATLRDALGHALAPRSERPVAAG